MARLALALVLLASPALAQESEYGFFSLRNTDFVVLLAFLLFVGVLLYFRVPRRVAEMLDGRSESIRQELAEARSLREEAQALLDGFERRRREVAEQSARIVADARAEAERASAQAQAEAARAVERRVAAAEDQIRAAEARAVRAVRDRAVAVAVAAAQEVLRGQMGPAEAGQLIDRSIDTVAQRLH